jgi:hypothetical protein
VIHNEANDETDSVRMDMDANYKREILESGKRRESSMGNRGSARKKRRGR